MSIHNLFRLLATSMTFATSLQDQPRKLVMTLLLIIYSSSTVIMSIFLREWLAEEELSLQGQLFLVRFGKGLPKTMDLFQPLTASMMTVRSSDLHVRKQVKLP